VDRERVLTAIERLALGAGMSFAAAMLELVLKRRMRRRAAVPAGAGPPASGDAPGAAPDR